MPAALSVGSGIAASAALGAGSSLLGSSKSSSASKSAASESLFATEASLATEQAMYSQNTARLAPYTEAGYGAAATMPYLAAEGAPLAQDYLDQASSAAYQQGSYLNQAAGMTPPSVMSEADLQKTPGYQFQLAQGLQSTQAAAAARGLGVSGASLKGAATYATGLADQNYQNQFNNAQTAYQDVMNQSVSAGNLGVSWRSQAQQAQSMQQQQYNQYSNLANLGESAAAQTAQSGTAISGQTASSLSSGAQQYGNYLTQAGQAQAAGTAGVGSAVTQGVNNALSYNAYQGYNQTLQGSQSGGWGTGYVDTGTWTTG